MALKYPGQGPQYARGGPPITTRSRFMKTPNVFTTSIEQQDYPKKGKGGDLSKTSGDSKSKTPPKPRK